MFFNEDPEKDELINTLLWLRNNYNKADRNFKVKILHHVDTVLNKYLPAEYTKRISAPDLDS